MGNNAPLADKACPRCWGKGWTGVSPVTNLPVFCPCVAERVFEDSEVRKCPSCGAVVWKAALICPFCKDVVRGVVK